jgi:hypothetical protein
MKMWIFNRLFQLRFRIRHQEGTRRQKELEMTEKHLFLVYAAKHFGGKNIT